MKRIQVFVLYCIVYIFALFQARVVYVSLFISSNNNSQ